MLANSPQTNDVGRMRPAISDSSHRPLGSPCAAEIHESRGFGPASTPPPPEVSSVSPRNVPTSTLPGLIGRKYHRLGMCGAVGCMLAARLPGPARAERAFAHRGDG